MSKVRRLGFASMILSAIFLMAMDYPPEGSDLSNLRCSGSIVSKGDSPEDVQEKCGDPVARGDRIGGMPYEIWVYRFPQTDYVIYFGFVNNRVQRIYQVSCLQDDPYCE
jgi:hypothetical protein